MVATMVDDAELYLRGLFALLLASLGLWDCGVWYVVQWVVCSTSVQRSTGSEDESSLLRERGAGRERGTIGADRSR